LNRLLRREKQQDVDAKQKAHLAQKIHAARVNLNYTIYCPLTEKYISLYPKSKGKSEEAGAESASESDSQERKKNDGDAKPPLWPVVEKCMEEGSLDLLREGKLNIGADGQRISAPSKKSTATAESQQPKIKKEHKEPKELKNVPEKEKRSSRHAESKKREKPGHKDHGRGRNKAHDVPAEPDGNDSDGGFFEE
jgi:rRNA-processing protein Efg1